MSTITLVGTSGDWAAGTLWLGGMKPGPADTAVAGGTAAYVVTIGTSATNAEFETVGALSVMDPAALLEIAADGTLATPGTIDLAAGTLAVAGTLSGGTLVGDGGVLFNSGGTLLNVTIDHSVTVTTGNVGPGLTLAGGLGFEAGATQSTLVNAGGVLDFVGNQTLQNGLLVDDAFSGTTLSSAGNVTFGSGFTLEVAGGGALTGAFTNDGTITVTTVYSTGGVYPMPSGPLTVNGSLFTNNGQIILHGGLAVQGGTTAELKALIASVTVGSGGGISVTGTLDNSNATLDLTGLSPLAGINFSAATILGGTVLTGPSSSLPAVLDAVHVVGPLENFVYGLGVVGGLTITAQGGGVGQITIGTDEYQTGASLNFGDTETFDNADITLLPVGGGLAYNAVNGAAGSTLTLGVNLSLVSEGGAIGGGEVINRGTVGAAVGYSGGAAGYSLLIDAASFVNAGTLYAGPGDMIEVADPYGLPYTGNFSNTGQIQLAAGGVLELTGSITTAQLAALAAGVSGPGAIEVAGLLNLAGGTLNLPGVNLVLAGTVENGSILAGNTVAFDGGTLIGATIDGAMTLGGGNGSTGNGIVDLVGGLNFGGAGKGTIVATGYDPGLAFTGGATLDNLVLSVPPENNVFVGVGSFSLNAGGPLVFGSGVTAAVTGAAVLIGTSIASAASIAVSGVGASLALVSNTITNTGNVSFGTGETLTLGSTSYSPTGNTLTFSNTGRFNVPAGSAINLLGTQTTAQLDSLIGAIASPGVTVSPPGVLVNTGATFSASINGASDTVLLGGDLVGGVLLTAPGTLDALGGTFDNVTIDGALTLAGYEEIYGNLLLNTAAGAPGGSLTLTGVGALLPQSAQTFDNATILFTGAGEDISLPQGVTSFGFGPNLTFDASGANDALVGPYERTSTFSNAGTIVVAGPGASLALEVNTLINSGLIKVGSGDMLSLNSTTAPGTLGLSGGGRFAFAAGSTLTLSGVSTAAELATMLGTSTGVTVDINGELLNTGSLLSVGSGAIAALNVNGDVVGGTIAGSPVSIVGTLDGVTYDGVLTDSGGLTVVDGLTLNTISGGPGGLLNVPSGGGASLALLDGETLNGFELNVLNAGILNAGILNAGFAISGPGIVALGSAFTLLADAPGISLTAATLANAGTLLVGAGDGLTLASNTIGNSGTIGVAAGGALGVNPNGALTLANTGSIGIAAGGILQFGGYATTAMLEAVVQAASGPGVIVQLDGQLVNTGTTIVATGGLATLSLNGEIDGGSVIAPAGTLGVDGAILRGVAVQGPLVLSARGAGLVLFGTTTVQSTAGGPGLITASGVGEIVQAENTLYGVGSFDSLDLVATGSALEVYGGFGAHGTLDVSGSATVLDSPGSSGLIRVNGASAALNLDQPSFFNSGTIQLGAGALLGLDVGGPAQNLILNGGGSVAVAAGATLELGGILTTAALQALLGSIAVPGVTVDLVGTIVNSGTVLDLAAGGLLGDVELNGAIVGGIVVNAGGLLGIGQATLFGTTFDGVLPLGTGSTLITSGGLTLNDVAGVNPGSVVVSGTGVTLLTLDPSLMLDHASVNLGGNLTVATYIPARPGYFASTGSASQVQFGSGFTVSGTGMLDVQATQFTNAGTIAVSGTHATVLLNASTIALPGSLSIGAGGTLGFWPAAAVYTLPVPSQFTATGSVSVGAGVSLMVGGDTTDAVLASLLATFNQPTATLSLDGVLKNTGTSFAPAAGSLLNQVSLGGTLIGGTLVPGDTLFTYNSPELQGVTVAGSLALTTPQQSVGILDGLTVLNPAGGPGTIDLTGSFGDQIVLYDSETLTNLVVDVAGGKTVYYQATQGLLGESTLTLGANVTIADDGVLELQGFPLSTAATINVAGTGGLVLQGSTFTNSGPISVAAGGTLALLPVSGSVVTDFANSGPVTLAAGATLEIGGINTTAQLLAELASISNPGVVVEVVGELINTGALLQATAGGLLSNLILDADVIGGTIAAGSGSLSLLGGELDGVTFQGPVTLAGSNAYIFVTDGLTLEGANGIGPGTLAVTGSGDTFEFGSQATLDNALLQVGTAAFSVMTTNNLPLTLGAGLSVSIASSLLLSGNGIIENAPLTLNVPGGTLALESDTLTLTAPIHVGTSAALALGTGTYLGYYGTAPTPLAISGFNDINLAAGATLGLGGIETTAQIANLVSGLSGEVLDLFGTVTNSGTTISPGSAGPFQQVDFSGLIEGGNVTLGSGGFLAASTFDNVALTGPLNLGTNSGASVALTGTTTLSPVAGTQEVITANGTGQDVIFSPLIGETFDNTLIQLGHPVIGTLNDFSDELAVGNGTVVLGAATTLAVTGAGAIGVQGGAANAALVNLGLITVGTGDLFVSAFGGYSYLATTSGSFVNQGVIAAGVSSFVGFEGSVSNDGTITLAPGAGASFDDGADAGGTISFAQGGEEVVLDTPGLFTATFQNFTAGNVIDLPTLPFAGSAVTTGFANGTLTVSSNAVAVAEIVMTGSIAYAASDFTPTQSPFDGGTEIISTAPCFAAGTRLRTAAGEMPVETLRVGDRVLTRAGQLVPIRWIGQRLVHVRRHPKPALVQPVRIHAGAFADGVPSRDLVLSPDHAIWTEGVLIPAYALVNGATITHEDVEDVHYFHVELPAHDLVYAEGLTTESYLDTGNRGQFAGATTALHPNFAPLHWNDACAPLCLIGDEVVRAKQALLDRAQALGHVRRAASLRVSGGVEVPCEGATRRFLLPAGLRHVCLTSDAGVPAELSAASTDRRRLGVAIGGALLDGRLLRLDGPGFWPTEGDRCWTDGAARLQLPRSAKRRVLDLQVLEVMQIWERPGALPLDPARDGVPGPPSQKACSK